jgi:putative ABC transport system permease protein
MKLYSLIRSAWQALLLHKLRSFLSTLGIVFAVVAVITMLSIAEGAKREAMEQIKQLGTNNIIIKRAPQTEAQAFAARTYHSEGLNLADATALEQGIPTIAYVAPLKEVRAAVLEAGEETTFAILAITESYPKLMNLQVQQGRFINYTDKEQKKPVCILGASVAKTLGDKGQLGNALRIENAVYRIVGILQERKLVKGKIPALSVRDYNQSIFIPLGTELVFNTNEEPGALSEILTKVKQAENMGATVAVLERILLQNHRGVRDFQIIVPQELLKQAHKTQRIFNIVLGCIAGISLLVGGIGIMNIMLANVSERVKEIGIKRAIGANRKHIALQFLAESTLLTFLGGGIGVVFGIGGSIIVNTFAGWSTVLTSWSMLLALAMAVCVGLLSGLYPAIGAARLDPVEALRYE